MRGKLISLFALIFLMSFAVSSSSSVEITIEGCIDGDYSLLVGNCSSDGHKFCLDNGTLIDSVTEGCSDDSTCCPAGYTCEGGWCNLRTFSCPSYLNKSSCEGAGDGDACTWFETGEGGRCLSDSSEGNCGFYTTNESCKADIYRFGQEGEGTKVCGTYTSGGQTIPVESCVCEWNEDSCEFSYNVSLQIGDSSFNCKKNFTIGECISGEQKISWTVSFTPQNTNQALLKDSKCIDDSKNRRCGMAATKLPGFSYLALILVILIIAIYYVVYLNKSKLKKRGKKK